MSNDNLNWEVATKDNLSQKIVRNPMTLIRSKKETGKTYGLGSIAIAVLFVGIVIFIEKRAAPQVLITNPKSSQIEVQTKENKQLFIARSKIESILNGNSFYRSMEVKENQLILELNSDELFDKASDGSVHLTGTATTVLTQLANEALSTSNLLRVQVTSHTDIRKISDKVIKHYNSNWELTAIMSAKILNIFESVGFAQRNLMGKGAGSSVPISPSRDINGHLIDKNLKMNRRVEVSIF